MVSFSLYYICVHIALGGGKKVSIFCVVCTDRFPRSVDADFSSRINMIPASLPACHSARLLFL
jgi:hypothetical protein